MTISRTCAAQGPSMPLYWGFSALTALTEAQVLALSYTRQAQDHLGDYEFVEAGAARYMWVAIPDAFGFIKSFKTGILNLVMIDSSLDITVNSVVVPYTLYRSSELQNATGIVLESN